MNHRFLLPWVFYSILISVVSCAFSVSAQVSITGFGTSFFQDFNTLALSGTSSVVPPGWAFNESGTNANTIYTAGTGSSNAGDTYSFGAASASDRAFGELRSGTVIPILGVNYVNNTGGTIGSLSIAYKGEQWRIGAIGHVDRMDFAYSTDAASLITGTWTDVNSLDFTAPNTTSAAGALNGNSSVNYTILNFTFGGLSIPNGASFWFRWTDFDATGSDDGLAIDSFSLKACPIIACPGNSSVCVDAAPIVLTGSPAGGNFVGTGVDMNMFNPADAAIGPNVITYNYNSGNGCVGSCNFTITVNDLPSASLSPVPDVCMGATSATLPFTNLSAGTTNYNIDYNSGANSAGFIDVVNGTISGSSIPLVIPGGAPSFTYGATLTLLNVTTMCQSDPIPFTITIEGCLPAPSMEWVLLDENGVVNGSCVSHSDCSNNILCYGLRYVPNHTGILTTYTTGFLINCTSTGNPVIDTSNRSCIMNQGASGTDNQCIASGQVLMNSSASGPDYPITQNVPVIIHQVCFSIPPGESITISVFPGLPPNASVEPTVGAATTEFPAYNTLTINRNLVCGILPLTWLSFNAKRYDDLMAQLDWTTTDEFNNAYFEVQRSIDFGRTFQTIGRVESTSRPEAVNAYQFIDRKASPGKNLYRIMQVDYDAHTGYSSVSSVAFSSKKFSVQTWPNPASEELNVSIHAAAGKGKISIFDLTGQLLLKKTFESGDTFEHFQIPDLKPGIYSLLVDDGINRSVEKIVVVD